MEQGNVFRQKSLVNNFETVIVSIPLEQGNVFRPLSSTFNAGITIVSIPLEQGNVFRPNAGTLLFTTFFVSIPLEQGNVFRQSEDSAIKSRDLSQSLWNRAMSFDLLLKMLLKVLLGLNPFGTGQCLSTAVVCWRQESCGLSDPLPNFLGRLRSWLLI